MVTKCVLCGFHPRTGESCFQHGAHFYHSSCAVQRIKVLEAEIEDMEADHADELSQMEHDSKEAGFAAGKRGGWL